MNPITVCPTADGLSRLINGQLPESESNHCSTTSKSARNASRKWARSATHPSPVSLHAAGTMPEMGKGHTSSR